MIDTNITKIGNSHYVLIPGIFVDQWGLKNGDAAVLRFTDEKIFIEIEKPKK